MSPKVRIFFFFLLKVFISAFLIGWILKSIDVKKLLYNLSLCHFSTYLFSFLSLCVCQILASNRWGYIVVQKEIINFSYAEILKTSFIGNFLNQGLPGSIGGDVYRSFMAVKKGASKTWAFHSLLLDRMFGVFFMGILGVFSLPFVWPKITSHSLSLSLMLVFVPIGIVLVCVVLSVVRIPFFTSFFETYRSFFKSFKAKFWAFGFFITLFLYLPLYLFALDLGYEITFSQILCIFPSVFLLSVLPISLAGWGVRETAFVMFFGAFGVAADKALTLSILYGLITFLFSFTGIIAYFIPISGKFKNLQNPLFNCPR